MSKKVLKGLLLLGVLGVLLQLACVTDSPLDPAANRPPDTFVTYFTVAVDANADGSFMTTIYWRGADEDGEVASYQYRVDGGAWTSTLVAVAEVDLTYPTIASSHTFEVKAIDNLGTADPTPAELTVSKGYEKPEVVYWDGPPNGANTTTTVDFQMGGSDADGFIASVYYEVDESGTWTEVAADPAASYTALMTFADLTVGGHTFAFKVKDNTGHMSEDALVISINVLDTFTPVFAQGAGPGDGGAWFAGQPATFAWTGGTSHYYSSVTHYASALNDATLNADGSYAATGWVAYDGGGTATYDLVAGTHVVYMALKDKAGNITYQGNTVDVVEASLDQGILLVNGVGPGYGGEATDPLEAKAYWGDLTISAYWDCFDGAVTATTLPAPIGGAGGIPPGVMAQYSTVIWIGNAYNGDDATWLASPIIEYLNAGGNVLLASRYGITFIYSDALDDYIGIWAGWRDGQSSIAEMKAIFPGLTDIPLIGGASLSEVWTAGWYMDSTNDDLVTNWDGQVSYHADETHTLLYCNRSSAANAASAYAYVRATGAWAHPNLEFPTPADDGSLTYAQISMPTPGTVEAQGNFVKLEGRPYRMDPAVTAPNYEWIVRNLFGEQ